MYKSRVNASLDAAINFLTNNIQNGILATNKDASEEIHPVKFESIPAEITWKAAIKKNGSGP